MCVLLGTRVPILLREGSLGRFQVVGDCYIHGLMDAESVLGPLIDFWKLQFGYDAGGCFVPHFFNHSTKETTVEDPRLGLLPPEWRRLPPVRTRDDPYTFARYHNDATGEVMNSDPRLLPEALRARGVRLSKFQLI